MDPGQNRVDVQLTSSGSLDKDLARVQEQIRAATAYAKTFDATLKSIKVSPKGIGITGFKDIDGQKVSFTGMVPGADAAANAVKGLKSVISDTTHTASSGIFGATFWANFASSGAMAVIGAIQTGISKVKDGLLEASKLQTRLIGSSSDVATGLGIGLQDALKLQETTQTDIARTAAALPGTTKDYTNIFEGISPVIASIYRGDTKGYQDSAMDLTRRTGVLAAKSNADPTMAGSALNRFISGTTGFQEVMMIDIFQKNALFQKALRDGLAQLGVGTEDWKKLTTRQREQITRNALRIATPDSLINGFKGTAEEVLQKIQTDLFDPLIGVFGFMRRVGDAGGRRAVDAFTQVLQNWDALVRQFSEAFGINVDPMYLLIKSLDTLADIATWLSKTIDKLKGRTAKVDPGGLNTTEVAMATGGLSAKGVNFGLATVLKGLLATDTAKIGEALGGAVMDALAGLGEFLLGVDWGQVLTLMVVTFNKTIDLLAGIFWGIVKRFGDLLKGTWDSITAEWSNGAVTVLSTLADFFRRALDWVRSLGGLIPGNVANPRQVQGVGKGEGVNGAVGVASNLMEQVFGTKPDGTEETATPLKPLDVPNPTQGNSVSQNSMTAPLTINTSNLDVSGVMSQWESHVGNTWRQLNESNLSSTP